MRRKIILAVCFTSVFGLVSLKSAADNCSTNQTAPVDTGSVNMWAGEMIWVKLYAFMPEGKLYPWAEPNIALLSKPSWVIEHELVVDDYNNAPVHLRSYCDGELIDQNSVRVAYRVLEVRAPLTPINSFVEYYCDDGQGLPDSQTFWHKGLNVVVHHRPFTDAVVRTTRP